MAHASSGGRLPAGGEAGQFLCGRGVMRRFDRDLDRITVAILRLATLVEERIFDAVRALCDRRPDLADGVIDGDVVIDQLEVCIEEDCLAFLAKHDPVAGDLRRIAAVLKVNHELERMADEAVSIAQRALALSGLPPTIPVPEELEAMTSQVVAMVRGSLDAFVDSDAAGACNVIDSDDDVDRSCRHLIDVTKEIIRKDPSALDVGLHLFSAASHLERIADHATNIAEEVVYLSVGSIIRHRHEEVPDDVRRWNRSAGVSARSVPI